MSAVKEEDEGDQEKVRRFSHSHPSPVCLQLRSVAAAFSLFRVVWMRVPYRTVSSVDLHSIMSEKNRKRPLYGSETRLKNALSIDFYAYIAWYVHKMYTSGLCR